MVRRTDPKDDVWQHVKDAKKRKQIQDRLAQRARHPMLHRTTWTANHTTSQRLREATNDPPTSQDTSITTKSPPCTCKSSASSDPQGSQFSDLILSPADTFAAPDSDFDHTTLSKNLLHFDMILAGLSSSTPDPFSPTPLILSPESQPAPPLTVFSALYLNGQILGVMCSVCLPSRSPHAAPHHPASLHPTESQLTTVHPRWMDSLPFPRMGDTLVRLLGAIDEEFLRDLFTMPSWRIEGRGGVSWDPRAWRMEEEWRGKWGWLNL